MPLPTVATDLAAAHLAAADASVPGPVTALWITGSAASGDWCPGRSDVDFVAADLAERCVRVAEDARRAVEARAPGGGTDAPVTG